MDYGTVLEQFKGWECPSYISCWSVILMMSILDLWLPDTRVVTRDVTGGVVTKSCRTSVQRVGGTIYRAWPSTPMVIPQTFWATGLLVLACAELLLSLLLEYAIWLKAMHEDLLTHEYLSSNWNHQRELSSFVIWFYSIEENSRIYNDILLTSTCNVSKVALPRREALLVCN